MKRTTLIHIFGPVLTLCVLLPFFAVFAGAYQNTGDGAADIVGTAREELGYGAGIAGAGKYGEALGAPAAQRSCAFVSWCAVKAEISRTVFPPETGCASMKQAFSDMGRYYPSAAQRGSYQPKTGDVIFFSSTKSAFNITHVGLVSAATESAVSVIEWAYGDKVSATAYTVDNPLIVGYASPAYETNAAVYNTGRYITNDAMRLRAAPSLDAETLAVIPVNSTVTVTLVRGVWGKTVWNGTEGWLSLEYSAYVPPTSNAEVNWLVADFSKWTTTSQIRWNDLRKDGVEAAILRIGGRGYGSAKALYTDDLFSEHYKNAKAAGLHVGVYFFSYALNEAQAKEEARLTISELRKYGCDPDMPVFIDIEDADGDYNYQHYRAGKSVCTKVVNAFCETIREAGYYPGVYCSKWFAENVLEPSAFSDRAVWIAQYGVAGCEYKGKIDLWQYTQSGRINSVTVKVDLSRCYTDFPALIHPQPQNEVYKGHVLPLDWKVTKQPTCAAQGQRSKTCEDCGKVILTEALPKDAHSASVDQIFINDFSIRAGSTLTGDLQRRLHAATEKNYETLYLATYTLKGGTKLTYCTTCKKVLTAEYAHPGCAHTKTNQNSTPSSCETQGVRETICADCGQTLKTELLPLAAHTSGAEKNVSVNCVNGGMRMQCCAVCGGEIGGEYAETLPHTFGAPEPAVRPTLFAEGKAVFTCAVCGAKEDGPLPPVTLGDADLDGSVEVVDARIALRAAVELETIEDAIAAVAADVDNNGEITVEDARSILRIAVGLDDPATLLAQAYPEASAP